MVTAELRDVHVTRMRFYVDDQLEITGELLKVFQQLENQGEYHIRGISAIKRAASGDEFVVKVAWKDWRRRGAPGSRCRACFMTRRPCYAKSSRRCGWLKAEHKRALLQRYGLRL